MGALLIPLRTLNAGIFRLFIVSIFFLYYQTRFLPGTIHTWLMLVGLMLLLPSLVHSRYSAGMRIPRDYLVVGLLLVVIVTGYAVNLGTATWVDLQAYVLMLATYVYVKENTNAATLRFLHGTCKYFLLVNGGFMMLQLVTGQFFPAALLAAGNPPLSIASGVSDGPTKNGMLILFALSFMYARFIFRRLPFSWLDMIAFSMGVVSIFLATSRAGIFGFVVVVTFGALFSAVQALRSRRFRLSGARLAFGAGMVALASMMSWAYGVGVTSLYEIRDPGADRYSLDALTYKLTVINDDSIGERFDTIRFFAEEVTKSPLHIVSVGFGTGTFEALYGKNIHNSYLELLFTTGIVGFALFIVLVFHVVRGALRAGDIAACPALFALIAIMTFMATHDVLRGRVFWMALGVLAAFSYARIDSPPPAART